MIEEFQNLHPVLQAFLATCFTWGLTALGAAGVFIARDISKRLFDGMLGFAAGVMIAASFWSLLAPAIRMSEGKDLPVWVPAVAGFLLGGICLRGIDTILPHLHIGAPIEEAEGVKTGWQRSTLLILAITLHNIPEGLAVGVAFGAVAADVTSATLAGAVALAIGIGIQNFPEGLAVSMPLRPNQQLTTDNGQLTICGGQAKRTWRACWTSPGAGSGRSWASSRLAGRRTRQSPSFGRSWSKSWPARVAW